ncbi:MAG: hypothetical protein K6E85_08375 [Lachnospiraceae bacterium]|nr:hypothetical protein [Lachnospiraceae bacterium]
MEYSDYIKELEDHFYRHPIFRWTGKDGDKMTVLVVGACEYAEAFVDMCLTTGQMYAKKLVIRWCALPNIKSKYLQSRPALYEFLSIDDEYKGGSEPYAHIYFENNDAYMEDRITDEARYLFAATDDYAQNAEIAELFKNASKNECLAAYFSAEGIQISTNDKNYEDMESSYADRLIRSKDELERMAFNTHLSWEGEGNLDLDGARKRFEKEYNYNSSVSFVLSIPYKLASIGINSPDPYAAAEKMYRIISGADADYDSDAAGMLAKLALLEHRRWVLEKVTQGARRLVNKFGKPEYASCVDRRSVKKNDKSGKLEMHPCITDATEATPLKNGKFADHALWDDTRVSTDELDSLDTMSVRLHREMYSAANQLRNDRDELYEKLNKLRNICGKGSAVLKMNYYRYYFCIENILDRSLPYSAQFETYEKMIRNSAEDPEKPIKEAKREELDACLKEIRYILYPALESNMYRDYKDYDMQLVKRIPYILTAKIPVHLCMGFGQANTKKSNNNDHFTSVASATALYADKVTYLFVYDGDTDLTVFESKLKAIHNYFYYRGMKCDICMNFLIDEEKSGTVHFDVYKVLKQARENGYIQKFRIFEYDGPEGLRREAKDIIKSCGADYYDGSSLLTDSHYENGILTKDIMEIIPYFEFDSYHKEFKTCIKCEHLKYVNISSFIQVEDMFALLNAQDKEYNYQDYSDCYRDMWEIYCGDAIKENNFVLCARCWTKLADVLKTGGADTLEIKGAAIAGENKKEKETIKLMLKALQRKRYISGLAVTDEDKVSCKLRSKKIKNLFMKAGDLLEIYVFFEACKTGYFDDIQTGFRFKWEFNDVTNEFDCVLTKGYRSIMIECKSTKEQDEQYYLTLDSLADHFGIGYKKVLIIVTDPDTERFNIQESRGKQMDIITVSKKEDLVNIGNKLVEIMEM